MKNATNPHEHVEYLRERGHVVGVRTYSHNPDYFEVLSSGPTWAYLVKTMSDQITRIGHPYWIRWEDISEFGIRFTTLEQEDK